MSKRIAHLEQEAINMAYFSVRQKVAHALLSLCSPQFTDLTKEIDIPREELATITGTAKESLIRTLSDFKSENAISFNGKKIILRDFDKLESICGQ